MYGAALATLLPHCHALRVSGHRLAKCVITSPQFRPGSFTARPYFDGSVAPEFFRPPGVLRKRRGDMKRLLITSASASLLACATIVSSAADAQSIECAARSTDTAKGTVVLPPHRRSEMLVRGQADAAKVIAALAKRSAGRKGRSCDATSRSRPLDGRPKRQCFAAAGSEYLAGAGGRRHQLRIPVAGLEAAELMSLMRCRQAPAR